MDREAESEYPAKRQRLEGDLELRAGESEALPALSQLHAPFVPVPAPIFGSNYSDFQSLDYHQGYQQSNPQIVQHEPAGHLIHHQQYPYGSQFPPGFGLPQIQTPDSTFQPTYELMHHQLAVSHMEACRQSLLVPQLAANISASTPVYDSQPMAVSGLPYENRFGQHSCPESSSSLAYQEQSNTTPKSQSPENVCATGQLFEQDDELCCFGMIPGINGSFERPSKGNLVSSFTVQLESAEHFVSEEPKITGRIDSDHGQMIQGLLDVPEIILKITCIPSIPTARKQGRMSALTPCVLELTVYGAPEFLDEIGRWFQDFDVYLQDPRLCHLDVRYCNPHRLSFVDLQSCPMVSEVISTKPELMLEVIGERPDLLDSLSSSVELEEAPQPLAIKSVLKRHQKEALYFMLCREQGWGSSDKIPDLWDKVDKERRRIYINTVSKMYQTDEPWQLYGGIIADPMGLGKTLTMIALVATDLDSDPASVKGENDGDQEMSSIQATLVIVPPPLISAWEEQLSDHVFDGALRYRRYHGKDKAAAKNELGNVNMVLTTYHTVSAEWKQTKGFGESILFSVRWRRIIIDEAHFIRNGNSRMAHAICALHSQSRWAVTGTPIQNRLGDLTSLLKFIRAHPYADPKQFDADISHLWKSGKDEEAVKRFKRLSSCLLLRRAKSTIQLPKRTDLECPVEFNKEEKEAYRQIHQQAIVRIDEVLQSEGGSSKPNVFVNVLQQIEALRLYCSLGLEYHTRHEARDKSYTESSDWSKTAQKLFNMQREMGSMACLQCASVLELTETLLEERNLLRQSGKFFKCLKFLCGECTQKPNCTIRCGHMPSCPAVTVSTSSDAFEEIDSVDFSKAGFSPQLPPKINALVADLKSIPPDVKCIVFSTWRLTLDVVKAALDQASLPCLRFDGKVPQKDRQSVVDQFRNDPSIRVMLLTLSCGAVGLTLTAASRAYLLEPHWNPTLEEQALARIHRLGQTKEVTTVRLYVRDSFEESVREVQRSKKQLANVLLSTQDSGQADTSLSVLEKLRSLL